MPSPVLILLTIVVTKYLLRTYEIPRMVLMSGHSMLNKTWKAPALLEIADCMLDSRLQMGPR